MSDFKVGQLARSRVERAVFYISKNDLIVFIKIIIFVLSKQMRRKWQSSKSIESTIPRMGGVTT